MLTRKCERCQGNSREPGPLEARCIGCKGTGTVMVSDDPVQPFLPSTSDGIMKVDPPPDPEKKAARKRALETCGKCTCCRRWKAKAHYVTKGGRAAVANAQYWANHWKQQYETLHAAQAQDHKTTER